jgi:hypothetical protein
MKIICPPEIAANSAGPAGTVVNCRVTASDDCVGPVTLVCTPPSGSVFLMGDTLVKCDGRDACGNVSGCSFHADVCDTVLDIERAVIVRWTCGTSQGASVVAGPYTDIAGALSPYCAPANGPHRFFRIRNESADGAKSN